MANYVYFVKLKLITYEKIICIISPICNVCWSGV